MKTILFDLPVTNDFYFTEDSSSLVFLVFARF